ncbi:hypothetical protein FKM82_012001 [Ascaphus truei]
MKHLFLIDFLRKYGKAFIMYIQSKELLLISNVAIYYCNHWCAGVTHIERTSKKSDYYFKSDLCKYCRGQGYHTISPERGCQQVQYGRYICMCKAVKQ